MYFGDSKLIGLAFSKVCHWIGEVKKPCVPFGNIHGCGNVFLLKSVRKDDESEQHLHENNISHPICVCNHDIKSKYHKSPKPKRLKRFSAVTDFSLPSSTSPNFCTKKLSHCTHLVLIRKTIERCQNEWHALSSSVVHLIQTIEKSYTHTHTHSRYSIIYTYLLSHKGKHWHKHMHPFFAAVWQGSPWLVHDSSLGCMSPWMASFWS